MFKPAQRARAAKADGNYALQIDFNDGHATGIYSYDYLRTICPCEECAQRSFRSPRGLIRPIGTDKWLLLLDTRCARKR